MLSHYQNAIIRWAKEGRGDGAVQGVAGCGKTFTLREVGQVLRGNVLAVAFNKHNADSLQRVMPQNVKCSTIHSLARTALVQIQRRLDVNEWKYKDIIDDLYATHPDREDEDFDDVIRATRQLVDFSRLRLTDLNDANAVYDLCSHFGISYYGYELDYAKRALAVGIEQFRRSGKIDWNDMIWLPVHLRLSFPVTYDFVLVDEMQDLSPCQLAVVLKARSLGGRMLFVGDPNQSIMGFAGADEQSYQNIVDAIGATELPLSICYRCPTSHLDLAREFVPHIEARQDAPVGIVDYITADKLAEKIQGEDLIICRTTAPLVSLCLKLIAQGVPARVRGRAIGEGFITVIKKIKKSGYSWDDFSGGMDDFFDRANMKALKKKHSDAELGRLADQRDALWAAYQYSSANSYDDFLRKIDQMFSDKESLITLSTIHRAKGLEANRVFVLKPEKMMLSFPGMQDWQRQQEANVKYVGLTRSKSELWFVLD